MIQTRYDRLAIEDVDQLVYGRAPRPVFCGYDLAIGDGAVFPEVNFTLPAIGISDDTWQTVLTQYDRMATAILGRLVALRVPGAVLEFELLPAMTETPEWGAEITALLHRHLHEAHEKHGLKCALRVTPTDIRDQRKPPELRSGPAWDKTRRSFELCIDAGADIVSIESVGGKEVHDQALLYGEFRGIVFSLATLAVRDMAWLWDRISEICAEKGGRSVPGGDTACGFANTAMQLAHQGMLPEVLPAVVRAMSAVRSLTAFEHGAVGPSKDCAYEGPIIKAITGCPISMEGKTASCAHFSPVGNIAGAMCDLWSNESVQNVRLLSGSAPEAFTETLSYDCRLMNVAARRGRALEFRDWMTESDEWSSPQAAVLSPASTLRIARAIVSESSAYQRTIAAGKAAVEIIREGVGSGRLELRRRELAWLGKIETALDGLPADEAALIEEARTKYAGLWNPASYGLLP